MYHTWCGPKATFLPVFDSYVNLNLKNVIQHFVQLLIIIISFSILEICDLLLFLVNEGYYDLMLMKHMFEFK